MRRAASSRGWVTSDPGTSSSRRTGSAPTAGPRPEERQQEPIRPLRSLEVRDVPRVEDDELRSGDLPSEALAVSEREEPVVATPEDQGRRADPAMALLERVRIGRDGLLL